MKFQYLLKLLDDDSPKVQQILRQTFLENSQELLFKRAFYDSQADAGLRPRLGELLENMHFDMVIQSFNNLLKTSLEDVDLEKAVLLLSYWNNPDLDISGLIRRLNFMAEKIARDLPMTGHPLAFIDHLNKWLFEKYRLRGNSVDYYNPDNSFIDRVLDNKKGIPISLSVIYMLISKRLDIPVLGVSMPAHFIVKFDNGFDEIFLDPFYNGKIYSRQECLNYLKNANRTNYNEILSGCSNVDTIMRTMRNIHLLYSSYKDKPQQVAEINAILELFENHFK